MERALRIEADADDLADRVQQEIGLVAHVDDEESPVFRGRPAEGHQFVPVGVHARRVDQAGGEAAAPLFHGRREEFLHLPELGRGSRAVLPAHDDGPHRPVGDERHRVGGGPGFLEGGKVLSHRVPRPLLQVRSQKPGDPPHHGFLVGVVQRGHGKAVLADQGRRDALHQLGVLVGMPEDPQVRVGVHVDETGGEDPVRGLDGPCGVPGEVPPHRGDPSPGNPDIGPEPGPPRPVEDPGIPYQEIEHVFSPPFPEKRNSLSGRPFPG